MLLQRGITVRMLPFYGQRCSCVCQWGRVNGGGWRSCAAHRRLHGTLACTRGRQLVVKLYYKLIVGQQMKKIVNSLLSAQMPQPQQPQMPQPNSLCFSSRASSPKLHSLFKPGLQPNSNTATGFNTRFQHLQHLNSFNPSLQYLNTSTQKIRLAMGSGCWKGQAGVRVQGVIGEA